MQYAAFDQEGEWTSLDSAGDCHFSMMGAGFECMLAEGLDLVVENVPLFA